MTIQAQDDLTYARSRLAFVVSVLMLVPDPQPLVLEPDARSGLVFILSDILSTLEKAAANED